MGKIWPSAGTGKQEKKKSHCQALPCNAGYLFSCCPGLETLKFFHSGLRIVLVTSQALGLRTICLPLQFTDCSLIMADFPANKSLCVCTVFFCARVYVCVVPFLNRPPSQISIELLHVFVESYLRSLTWWYRHVLNSHFQDAEATERHCEFQTTLSYKETKK